MFAPIVYNNFTSKALFYYISVFVLLFCYVIYLNIISNKEKDITWPNTIEYEMEHKIDKLIKIEQDKKSEMKYILQWMSRKDTGNYYLTNGRDMFVKNKCSYTNCVITKKKYYLGDYTKFDAVAFAGPEAVSKGRDYFPKRRSKHQKYIFTCMESPDNFPVTSDFLNGYFNWTWTFRLDSDTTWGYISIKDKYNKTIGPKKEMHWLRLDKMDSTDFELKESLKSKKKAGAWFVSNCQTKSRRMNFVKDLIGELEKYKLNIDIYGGCGSLETINNTLRDERIRSDYYFYLAMENSLVDDYVTEKLLIALQNNAVPIVYGGANYTRFMPQGIYLNARDLGAKILADKMNELIEDPEKYLEYFRWKKHYSYYNSEGEDYCRFCAMLNDNELMKNVTIYENFRKWWNYPSLYK